MLKKNSTDYPLAIASHAKRIYKKYKEIEDPYLLFHQYFIREYFADPVFGIGQPENPRGLLLNHGTGTGKTAVAVSVYLALADKFQTIVLLPKSLQQNFLDNIDRLIDDPKIADSFKDRLSFVSLDAFNSGDTLKTKSGTLDNKLLIVDEAHNLFKSIINSGDRDTNAKIIYNMIMGAINLRILFLSGTPITKDPFELVACCNMIMGDEILPSNYDTFEVQYIKNRSLLINKNKLQNRLFGLISYIRFDLPMFPGDVIKDVEETDKPKDLGIKVERIEMSRNQYTRYISIRDKEDRTAQKRASKNIRTGVQMKREAANMSLPNSGQGSSYYIESRMISNFSVPLDILREDTKNIDKKYFTKDNSPKIFRLIQNIKRGKKPVLVYSQFLQGGLDAVSQFLKEEGFEEWTVKDEHKMLIPRPRFAAVTGKVSPKDRPIIIKAFNRANNMYGDIIAVLLISETGAEGLDLKNIRVIHILEPYWDMARIYQIQGRGIRKGSHVNLPENERDVQTIIYISVPNKEEEKVTKFKEDESIDLKFLNRAMRRMNLINEFNKAMKEVSLECISNEYGDCRVCVPDNVPLYSKTSVNTDIAAADPCRDYTTKTKEYAKKIVHNGVDYYYKKDRTSPFGYYIYVYNKELDGYNYLSMNEPIFLEIIKKI